jgi:hypothetical protein
MRRKRFYNIMITMKEQKLGGGFRLLIRTCFSVGEGYEGEPCLSRRFNRSALPQIKCYPRGD